MLNADAECRYALQLAAGFGFGFGWLFFTVTARCAGGAGAGIIAHSSFEIEEIEIHRQQAIDELRPQTSFLGFFCH